MPRVPRCSLRVAIDGPSGSGKSTIARAVARELGCLYLDTGAMYRVVTLAALRAGTDVGDETALTELARGLRIDLLPVEDGARGSGVAAGTIVLLNGEPVTEEIRSPEVGRHVSHVASVAGVRRILVDRQREIARHGGAVLDGRDIGTVVLPDAEVKVFLTASLAERARRRLREQLATGFAVTYPEVSRELAERDRIDSSRAADPLRKAADAVAIDTTGMTIEQVTEAVLELCLRAVGRASTGGG
jgi:cytidylate kinase